MSKISKQLLSRLEDQLIRHEKKMLKVYRCPAGKLTIGVGRNLDDKGISSAEALILLKNDIKDARADVAFLLDKFRIERWKPNQARQDVLANMAFNMGRASLAGFRNMFAAIRAEDFEEAARQMLDSKYARDVGVRANELAEQMRTGEYQL